MTIKNNKGLTREKQKMKSIIKINGKDGGTWIDVKDINFSRGNLTLSDGDNTINIPRDLVRVLKRKIANNS